MRPVKALSLYEIKVMIRREHQQVDYPVSHCRKCGTNWPCDAQYALQMLDFVSTEATQAERQRLVRLAKDRNAVFLVKTHRGASKMVPFADLMVVTI